MEGGVASNEHKYESSSESDTDGAIGGGGGDVPIPYEHACEIYRNLSKTALAKVLSTSPDLNHPSFFTSFNKRLDESLPLLNKEGGITYAELHNSVFQTTFVEAVKLGCESLKAESSKSLQQQQLYYQGGGAASKARGRASLTNTISPIISWMAKSAKADVFRPRDERLVISDEAIQNALNRNALIIKELHHIVDTHKRKLQVPSAVKDVSKEVMDRILYLQEFSKVLLTNLAELADCTSNALPLGQFFLFFPAWPHVTQLIPFFLTQIRPLSLPPSQRKIAQTSQPFRRKLNCLSIQQT